MHQLFLLLRKLEDSYRRPFIIVEVPTVGVMLNTAPVRSALVMLLRVESFEIVLVGVWHCLALASRISLSLGKTGLRLGDNRILYTFAAF